MNTIYWLAIFGTIVGFGVFLLSILGVWFTTIYGNIISKAIIEHDGWLPCLRWNWLLVGCACLIIGMTV